MASYDAQTENGIPYFAGLYRRSFEYRTVVDDLDTLFVQRREILKNGSVQGYTIGSRSITRNQLSPDGVLKQWSKLMAEKLRLESGGPYRKAVGVVFRDW